MGYATIGTYLPITSSTPRHADQILLAADEKWREEERWNLYETSNLGIPETLPMTSKAAAARSFAPDLVNIGTSAVVPYTEEVITKTETVKLTVTPEELAMLRKDVTYPFTDRQAFGPHVTQVEVISLPKVRAPRAEATDGKAVTKYVVISAGRELASADTQAEARQKAIEMMKADERISKLSVEAPRLPRGRQRRSRHHQPSGSRRIGRHLQGDQGRAEARSCARRLLRRLQRPLLRRREAARTRCECAPLLILRREAPRRRPSPARWSPGCTGR